MAKVDFKNLKGVWRTVGGRRIFIRDGQNLSSAMKDSGKFKKKEDNTIEEYLGRLKKERQELLNTNPTSVEDGKRLQNEIKNLNYKINDIELKRTIGGQPLEDNKRPIDKLIEKNNKLNKELEEKGISYSDYSLDKMVEKKTKGKYKSYDEALENYKNYANNTKYAEDGSRIQKMNDYDKWVEGKRYREKLDKIKSPDIPDGTYDLNEGKPVDFKGKGYNVSFEQSGVKLDDKEYYEAIDYCRNKCDGKVYAGKFGGDPEISFYTKDKKVALELMEKYNQHSIWDNSIGDIIENPKYDESKNKVNYKAKEETTSTPTRVRSTKKEVVDKIRKHIMDYYDTPEDLVRDMDAGADPRYDLTSWKKGSRLVDGGSFLIYNGDMSDELNKWGINPSGKKYSEDKSYNMYKSLVGREAGKIYDEYQKSKAVSNLKTLSDIQQYYIEQGYSNATALKYAKQEIAKRKKR